ncbi:hypothetical protein RF11_04086 [Thelohanellus kitauei]|uniref:Uncharacterized protein n=1 Tax=Thelohanellus kitauei TaxID=669202 RepID=A0A0C2JJC2_THEKT|nr:hypothetical protein RF11_04086 [Thelohanellus kitauei]
MNPGSIARTRTFSVPSNHFLRCRMKFDVNANMNIINMKAKKQEIEDEDVLSRNIASTSDASSNQSDIEGDISQDETPESEVKDLTDVVRFYRVHQLEALASGTGLVFMGHLTLPKIDKFGLFSSHAKSDSIVTIKNTINADLSQKPNLVWDRNVRSDIDVEFKPKDYLLVFCINFKRDLIEYITIIAYDIVNKKNINQLKEILMKNKN